MKPEYEHVRQRGDNVTTAARVPETLLGTLKIFAEAEGDNVTGLIIEGLVRVVVDRQNDMEYLKRISSDSRHKLIEAAKQDLDDMGHVVIEINETRAFIERLGETDT